MSTVITITLPNCVGCKNVEICKFSRRTENGKTKIENSLGADSPFEILIKCIMYVPLDKKKR
jgi:hypothetical protein